MQTHDHDQPGSVDPARPEQVITAAAAACSNWGRWGYGDVRGAPIPVTSAVGAPVNPIAVK